MVTPSSSPATVRGQRPLSNVQRLSLEPCGRQHTARHPCPTLVCRLAACAANTHASAVSVDGNAKNTASCCPAAPLHRCTLPARTPTERWVWCNPLPPSSLSLSRCLASLPLVAAHTNRRGRCTGTMPAGFHNGRGSSKKPYPGPMWPAGCQEVLIRAPCGGPSVMIHGPSTQGFSQPSHNNTQLNPPGCCARHERPPRCRVRRQEPPGETAGTVPPDDCVCTV